MKQLIAGNWKMNLTTTAVVEMIDHLQVNESSPEVIVCPPFPYLSLSKHVLSTKPIQLGAQDCHQAQSGAFTGDVSASMLADVGCTYVVLGHSERRQGHGESSDLIHAKAKAAISQGLKVIICIGETDGENQSGLTQEVLRTQLKDSLPEGLTSENLVVAYEPVWAIGTGRTASSDEIIGAHAFIRQQLQAVCSDADNVRILYGGSVNAKNAAEILALPNVNGVLVGGASLKPDDFNEIIRSGK
jgi:triosephosphate isomerase (TIM)